MVEMWDFVLIIYLIIQTMLNYIVPLSSNCKAHNTFLTLEIQGMSTSMGVLFEISDYL
jgi:hypothetical protein